jgi:hypothetical protein
VPAGLEIYLRLVPPTDTQTNNEYKYRIRTGEKKFLVPYHSWHEKYPVKFDVRRYYEKSNYTVDYHFNQFGARWIEDRDQPLVGTVFFVLGDSFSYGSGLQYEDTYIYKTQDLLAKMGTPYTFLNFAQSGADVLAGLGIYRSLPDSISHDAIVYGLHLNDLIRFDTSFVSKNQALGLSIVKQSKFLEFISKKLNSSFGRYLKIKYLTSPEVFQKEKFKQNMRALVQLDAIARRRNIRFYVTILPVLIDVKKKTFTPVYLEIERILQEKGIKHIDLTGSLEAYEDRELWILPVDQHPNEIANEVFARSLASYLAAEVIRH